MCANKGRKLRKAECAICLMYHSGREKGKCWEKYKVRPQTHCDAVLSESSIRHAMVQFCLSCSRLNFSYTTTRHISIKFLSRAQSSGFLGFLPVLKSHPKFWSHGTIVNICTCSPFALQWSRGHFVCFRNAILLEFGWWIVHFVRHSYWFTSS